MKPIAELYHQLIGQKKILVTMHQKPDPDAMGSALGLYHFLRLMGHSVSVVSPTNWATFLNWMPDCDKVMDYENYRQREQIEGVIKEAEVLFCLDFNTISRTKNLAAPLTAMKAVKVLIDHHQQPDTA